MVCKMVICKNMIISKKSVLKLYSLADDLAKRKQIEELVKTWDSRPNSSK